MRNLPTLSAEVRIATEGQSFPKVVCLCGSTRFGDAYRDATRNETLEGNIVLSVGLLGHAEGLDMGGPLKTVLDELHKRKIDHADEILVLNVGGYIGSSTRGEIEYATRTGKKVRYLEDPEDVPCPTTSAPPPDRPS